MKFVGRIARARVAGGDVVRVSYPPFDVLVSEIAGEYFAIEDACNHAGASLSEGPRHGNRIACPMHGYLFDLKTGELVQPRGLCAHQRRFVCDSEGDEIVIWDPFDLTIELA